MTEQESVEAHVPITISIDVQQLLRSELGWTPQYSGHGPDDYEEEEPLPGGNGKIVDVVAAKLADAIKKDVLTDVKAAVKETALAKVDALIDEIMIQPLTLTSSYGEPKSGEMTLREAMIKAMNDRLTSTVDSNGKPLDRNGYGRGMSFIQWHAEQAARAVLDKELTGQISAAVKQIKTAATNLVTTKIGEALGRALS